MILCMRSIPGVVEESQDFIDSTHDTAWVESSFLGSQQTDFTQSMIVKGASKKRPRSAPQRRQTFGGDFMSSSPDLSSCSEPGPLELFTSRSAQPQGTCVSVCVRFLPVCSVNQELKLCNIHNSCALFVVHCLLAVYFLYCHYIHVPVKSFANGGF